MTTSPRPIRVLYVTQWFEPEPAFKGINFALGLSEQGFEVEVLTGFPNYPTGKIYPGHTLRLLARETQQAIPVTRVYLYPSHDSSAIGRTLNYLSFCLSVFIHGIFRKKYDVIYVYHPPITAGLGVAISRLFRRTPMVLDIQDLWPDSVAVSGMGSKSLVRIISPLCRLVYRSAARILVQSVGMRQRLVERGVPADKLFTILNWADEAALATPDADNLADYGFGERFTFTYAGNIGKVQAMEAVVEAAKRAHAVNPAIRLLIVGDGLKRDAVMQAAGNHPAIDIKPAVSRERIASILRRSEVQLVHLADDPLFEITIPSKVQFYLAVGRPILAAITGEAARLVTDVGAGKSVKSQDPDAIAAAMLEMAALPPADLERMGTAGRGFYGANLSFRSAMIRTAELLREITRPDCIRD